MSIVIKTNNYYTQSTDMMFILSGMGAKSEQLTQGL